MYLLQYKRKKNYAFWSIGKEEKSTIKFDWHNLENPLTIIVHINENKSRVKTHMGFMHSNGPTKESQSNFITEIFFKK